MHCYLTFYSNVLSYFIFIGNASVSSKYSSGGWVSTRFSGHLWVSFAFTLYVQQRRVLQKAAKGWGYGSKPRECKKKGKYYRIINHMTLITVEVAKHEECSSAKDHPTWTRFLSSGLLFKLYGMTCRYFFLCIS